MPKPLVIAEYDADWPRQFELLKARIAEAFGPLAVSIEHVGSTSVPGLAAKPVIDLDIAVPEASDIAEGIRLLTTIGYEHEGDLGITGREAFSVPPGSYAHHPYLVALDGREFKRHIAFRDRLRSDVSVRREYEELKRQLASEFTVLTEKYWKAKTDFIERILAQELGPDH